jgi:preprotein translocase subunit SecY
LSTSYLPGIDATQLGNLAGQTKEGIQFLTCLLECILKLLFFALGIMPYISASIVVQLMGSYSLFAKN